MRNRSPAKVPGFSLIEMVCVLSLFALAGTIIVPLMHWSVTALRTAQQHTDMSSRFDLATSQLRADVWQAKKLTATSADTLTLALADGENVTWKLGPGDQLSRGKSRWVGLGIASDSKWSADTGTVRLVIPSSAQGDGKSISLLSETLVLSGGRP